MGIYVDFGEMNTYALAGIIMEEAHMLKKKLYDTFFMYFLLPCFLSREYKKVK